MKVTGFDNHIDETMELVGDFIRHAKADDKKLRQIVDDAKVSEKAFFKSGDNVASALLEQVKYGDQSRYLRKLSLSQIKKLKGKDMLAERTVRPSLLRHIACRKGDRDDSPASPIGTDDHCLQFSLLPRVEAIRPADRLFYRYAGYGAEHRLRLCQGRSGR